MSSKEVEMMSVGIIGGGISGLGSAYHLLKTAKRLDQPLTVEIFDKNSSPGGTWSKDSVYEGLMTNNSWSQMLLDDDGTSEKMFKEDPSCGAGPGGFRATGKAMLRTMESVASQVRGLGGIIHTAGEVISVHKSDKDRWIIQSRKIHPENGSQAQDPTPSKSFDKIVIATGAFSTPAIPACASPFVQPNRVPIKAEDLDKPIVIHTSHLSDPTVQDALNRGSRSMVIVGASKSALDAAERFATLGHTVSIVLQNPPYLAPACAKTPDGLPADAVAMVGTREKVVTVPYFPDPVSKARSSGGWYAGLYRMFLHTTWLGSTWLHAKVTARSMAVYAGWGQWANEKLAAMRPRIPLMWSESSIFPGPTNFAQLVKEDKIQIVKGTVMQMSRSNSEGTDGYDLDIGSELGSRKIFATGVIFGTGWSTGSYPFFNNDQLNSLGLPLPYIDELPERERQYTDLDRTSLGYVTRTFRTMRNLPREWLTPGFSARFAGGGKTVAPYRLYRLMVPLDSLYDRDVVFAGIPTCKANHVLFIAQAHWIADYFLGTLPNLPTIHTARKEISLQTVWAQRLFGVSHGRLGQWLGACWIEYCSRLCWDMGVQDDGKGWNGVITSGSYHLEEKRAARDLAMQHN